MTSSPINAFFLVALHAALGRWIGADDLCVWLEGHGRESITEDVDLTRTIGWFTSLFPLRLQLDRHGPLLARIAAVTRALARPAHHGLGYLALRTMATDPAIRAALTPPWSPLVTFNYLGRLDDGADDRLLTLTDAPAGPLHGPANARHAALDLNCFALDGRLRIDVTFSTEQLEPAAVERFTASFIAELEAVDDAAPARAIHQGDTRSEPDASMRLRSAASTARPLFLVHPAGGSAFGYRELVRHLDGDRPVYGLECTDGYAGKTLTSMAAGYVEAMRAVQPGGRYVLGGWSLGGIIAAEMARLLESAGAAGQLITGHGQSLPIRAPMLLLRASTGSAHYPGFPALEEPVEVGADTTYGWGTLAGGGCAVELVAGTHEDLMFGPHARGLAERLSRALR